VLHAVVVVVLREGRLPDETGDERRGGHLHARRRVIVLREGRLPEVRLLELPVGLFGVPVRLVGMSLELDLSAVLGMPLVLDLSATFSSRSSPSSSASAVAVSTST
jgi:hypothetical protein